MKKQKTKPSPAATPKKPKVCCAWVDYPDESDDELYHVRLWTDYYDETNGEDDESVFMRGFKHKYLPTLRDRAARHDCLNCLWQLRDGG